MPILAAASLLLLSACVSTSSGLDGDPFLNGSTTRREATTRGQSPAEAKPGRVHIRASSSSPAEPEGRNSQRSQPAVHFTPAQRRVPIRTGNSRRSGANRGRLRQTRAQRYPDEYLFDGGDRGMPIHYDRYHRLGLETEDAVAEYLDDQGHKHVQATNRVAIYAPRFAAVRSFSGPRTDVSVAQLAGTEKRMESAGLQNRTGPHHQTEHTQPGLARMRSRASGLEQEAQQAGAHQVTPPSSHTTLVNPVLDLAFTQTGQFQQNEEAYLAQAIQAALVWTRDQYPVIAAQTQQAQEVRSRFKAEAYTGIEEKHKSQGRLRIVKLADKKSVSPGDVVTFSLRYDNLGDRALHHIRIIDNLTPRLTYIEGSATSDRPGQVVIEDNSQGSEILRFELENPLNGHQGGVITFKARVR